MQNPIMMRLLEQLLRNPYKFKIGDLILFVDERNDETGLLMGKKYFEHNQQTVSVKLRWSHFERLITVEDKQARAYYLKEATEIECEKLFIKQQQGL